MASRECSACRAALPWYVNGHLAPKERARIDRHLPTCAACRRELAAWRAIAGAANTAAQAQSPSALAQRQTWHALQARIATAGTVAPARPAVAPTPFQPRATDDLGVLELPAGAPTPRSSATRPIPRRQDHRVARRLLGAAAALLLVAGIVRLISSVAHRPPTAVATATPRASATRSPVAQHRVVWTQGIANSAQFVPYLAVGQGILYYNDVGDGSTPASIVAVRAADGHTAVWQHAVAGGFNGGTLPVVDGSLVLDASFNTLLALDANTGATRWSFTGTDVGSTYTSPTVANGVVYFSADHSATLYAVRETSGTLLWSTHLGAGSEVINGAPVVAGGTVYTGGADGDWYAVNATTGQVEWQYQTLSAGQQIPSFTAGVVAGGLVYFYAGGFQDTPAADTLYALRLSDHSVAWQRNVPIAGPPPYGLAPVVAGNELLFADGSTLLALDLASGQLRWQRGGETLVGGVPFVDTGAITVVGGTIYCPGPAGIIALNTSGTPLWSQSVQGAVGPIVVVANNVLYVGSADTIGGRITAIAIS